MECVVSDVKSPELLQSLEGNEKKEAVEAGWKRIAHLKKLQCFQDFLEKPVLQWSHTAGMGACAWMGRNETWCAQGVVYSLLFSIHPVDSANFVSVLTVL